MLKRGNQGDFMETIQYNNFSLALSLFILLDPFGNIPTFIAILKNLPTRRQLIVIMRELSLALVIIILFAFLGRPLLNFLRVGQETILISGGLILFMIALKMIFPKKTEDFFGGTINMEEEPFIVPLAIPLIAGPSVLAAVMIYSHQEDVSTLITAICIAWILATLILFSVPFLKRIIGVRGVAAGARLMGLVLTLISVQMFLDGISIFINK